MIYLVSNYLYIEIKIDVDRSNKGIVVLHTYIHNIYKYIWQMNSNVRQETTSIQSQSILHRSPKSLRILWALPQVICARLLGLILASKERYRWIPSRQDAMASDWVTKDQGWWGCQALHMETKCKFITGTVIAGPFFMKAPTFLLIFATLRNSQMHPWPLCAKDWC